MKVFLFEYFTACRPASAEFHEGFAMLKTFISSFLKAGAQVLSIFHSDCAELSLKNLNIEKNQGWEFGSLQFMQLFHYILKSSDAVLLIAPETSGLLAQLTSCVEKSGKLNLGSSSAGIVKAQNKQLTCSILSEKGFKVPRSYTVKDLKEIANIAKLTGYPLVAKPAEGIDGIGVYLVEKKNELIESVQKASAAFKDSSEVLIQEYIPGNHMSVTILGGTPSTPISLNKQYFDGYKPFKYKGGKVEISHPYKSTILKTATAAWDVLGGLRGYGGVDLVYNNEGIHIIEINPRPTTPLIALDKCLENNLAEMLLQSLNCEKVNPVFYRSELTFNI